MRKVILATGGTGGHIIPAKNIAEQLLERGGYEILFVGAKLKGNPSFPQKKFSFREIKAATPFTRKFVVAMWKNLRGFFQSMRILFSYSPDLVIGFGSFAAFPILLAAVIKRVPIILFEANTIPGKVNRLFSKWARITAIQFPETANKLRSPSALVYPPLNIGAMTKQEARTKLSLDPEKTTLLVFGGSQGALAINEIMKKVASVLEEVQVIHVTGSEEAVNALQESYKKCSVNAYVSFFEENMGPLYTAADLALCRAGSSTLSELISFELPSILIPYPYATDQHQQKNAKRLETIGGALTCTEEKFEVKLLQSLLANGKKREKMKKAIANSKDENRLNIIELIENIFNAKTQRR